MSKPCEDCMSKIEKMSRNKGYSVNRIYYSTDQNTIEFNKIHTLQDEENKHVSKYYRKI